MTDEQKALREAVVKLYADKYQITDAWLADAAIAVVLERAVQLTKYQAQAFRDDAHNRKQWGDSMMHKRGLAVAAYFDQHAAAIRALIPASGAGPSQEAE